MAAKGESAKYLPPALSHDAWVLDEYGTWVRVYYEGAYRYFWRPVHVGVGWKPFTVGRWRVWYGDRCWIPAERFGYVTHHYGNWVLVRNRWYWAPPVVRAGIRLGSPFFSIGFSWYPGRVAWIHSGVHIGWVPLAPFEPYYSHRRWGRRSIVVKNVNKTNFGIHRYRYSKRAVFMHRDNFHRSHKTLPKPRRVVTKKIYKKRTDTKRHDFKNVRPLPNSDRMGTKRIHKKSIEARRHSFKNNKPLRKPHRIVTKKIHKKGLEAKGSAGVSARVVKKKTVKTMRSNPVKSLRRGEFKVKRPMIRARHVSRPVSGIKSREKNLRGVERLRGHSKFRERKGLSIP
jgi:hypothetical protein